MASKVCLNPKCGKTTTSKWRTGWALRSGRIADLCDTCGCAYEQMAFCETFHSDDTGWRPCNACKKRVHCGCIASNNSFVLLDTGGIECITCARNNSLMPTSNQIEHPAFFSSPRQSSVAIKGHTEGSSWKQIREVGRSNDADWLTATNVGKQISGSVLNTLDDNVLERYKKKHLKMHDHGDSGQYSTVRESMGFMNDSGYCRMDLVPRNSTVDDGNTEIVPDTDVLAAVTGSVENIKSEDDHIELDNPKGSSAENEAFETPASACLNFSLVSLAPNDAVAASSDPSTPILGLTISTASPGKSTEQIKIPATDEQQLHLPKPSHSSSSTGSESSKDCLSRIRVACPPGEGRGQNQLLPRYWPRITNQELKQISRDSNATTIPLFEKVLSASDAGRIGRLVLPKACAEPEGVPLKIQDARGKDWIFQFRFWPNNNSRMYVLEGVTPCIQSMQLQAGDTVTFHRLDPEGKLVMGFRKALNSASSQEGQPSVTGNDVFSNEGFNTRSIENLPPLTGFSGLLLHSMKGNGELHMNALTDQLSPSDADFNWYKTDKVRGKLEKNSNFQSLLLPHKNRSRNLGSKVKRLRIDNEDALELKLTWEEAQDLLRPPPKAVPSIVMIEDHEFEEYEDPPVFGKRTIFTTDLSGAQNQWAQCGDCRHWRRVPMDAFLPLRWACADNTWDSERASCSVAQEMSSEELEDLLRCTTGLRKHEAAEGQKVTETSSPLDTLASAAVLGQKANSFPSAPTTKHPRHRPGCTCIVCIQPPSGKGPKHKPTCTCNVCMTVKRRFKTLMMRRKKRQSEQEAENILKKHNTVKDEREVNSRSHCQSSVVLPPENSSREKNLPVSFKEGITRIANTSENRTKANSDHNLKGYYRSCRSSKEDRKVSKGQIDLNSQPEREEELSPGPGCLSMGASISEVELQRNEGEHGVDEQTCISSPIPAWDQITEEQLFITNKIRSDAASISIQVSNQSL